jgi:hypothetical protein
MSAHSVTGGIGSLDMSLPLSSMLMYGGGQVSITLPKNTQNINVLNGQVSELDLLLENLAIGIVSHVDEFSRLDIKLPIDSVRMRGFLNGVGSLNLRMPLPTFLGHSITGQLGQIRMTMPAVKVSVHSYHDGRMIMDFDLPSLALDIHGRYIPVNISYKGITVNTRTMAVTENNNLSFNSMGILGSKGFGANENGIYMLGGKNDNESYIATGSYDLGRNALSVPRDAWLSLRTDGKMILTLVVDENNQYEYEVYGLSDHIHEERVKFGRGLIGRFDSFKIRNVDGADFDLSKFELFVDSKTSRKR